MNLIKKSFENLYMSIALTGGALKSEILAHEAVVTAEIERLQGIIERDRTKLATIKNNVHRAIARRSWLLEGRGGYAYDDEEYEKEFGLALKEIEDAILPLGPMALDWTDCPTNPAEIKKARDGLSLD